jgi:cation:H+ antiporter
MLTSLAAIVSGLILLVWSAERFVSAASALAAHFGVPALLIGMVVIGFGTSAPEMTVSAISAATGNPGIALGNAYGSNITNIALILGLTALIRPVRVHSRVLRSELPLLIAATALAGIQLLDGTISRLDAFVLLGAFAALLGWSLWTARRRPTDALADDVDRELAARDAGPGRSLAWLMVGLAVLVASSRLLVWGAVNVAEQAGISDLVIGLTIVAVGTSLPELASSIVAARRGEHDLAFGNIIGSNLFNTLTVVGIAGAIRPLPVMPELVARDLPVVAGLTLVLLLFGYGFRGAGRINRVEGGLLVAGFVGYTLVLLTA